MESTTPTNKQGEQSQVDSAQEQASASFYHTFVSIETLVNAKVQKLVASKALVEAEAKLSLSALILSLAICLLLVVITTVIWALLNTGLGILIAHFSGSIALALVALIIVNALLGVWLFKELKSVWNLIGFTALSDVINE